jgi:hypothetical protein
VTQAIQTTNMLPATDYRISAIVARLILAKLSPSGGDWNQALANEYLEALHGIPEWALEKAANDYRFGRVGDGKFAPFPAEIAILCRKYVDEEIRDQARVRTERTQVQEIIRSKQLFSNRTAEERARVDAIAKAAQANIMRTELNDVVKAEEMRAIRHEQVEADERHFGSQYQFGSSEKWGFSV